MKRIITVFVLLVVVFAGCLDFAEAKAAESVPEWLAAQTIDWCANNGVLESQTLDEFRPGAVATVGDLIDWTYSATELKEKGGFALAKNHTFKKQRKWLDDKVFSAMIANPENATQLSLDYTMGKKRKLKASDPVTYDLVYVCARVINGERSYIDDPAEIERSTKNRWATFNGTWGKMTKIELLDLVKIYFCDDPIITVDPIMSAF